MDEIKKRLERELSHTVQRIRHMGGVMTFEELGAAGVTRRLPTRWT